MSVCLRYSRPRRASRAFWFLSSRVLHRTLKPCASISSFLNVQLCTTPKTTSPSPSHWPWPSSDWTPIPAKCWVREAHFQSCSVTCVLFISKCPVLCLVSWFFLFLVKMLDNWWSLLDREIFSRLVEMYKSIVVFLLTGGKALLIPVFQESYINATLNLLEKLHKVSK